MPLHSKDGLEFGGFHRFNHAIAATCRHSHAMSGCFHGLVMEGIHCDFIVLKHFVKNGVGIDVNSVGSILARHILTVLDSHTFLLRIDVLIEFATEGSRDDLNAFANTQHRNLSVVSKTHQKEFLLVALRTNGMKLRNGLLTQE